MSSYENTWQATKCSNMIIHHFSRTYICRNNTCSVNVYTPMHSPITLCSVVCIHYMCRGRRSAKETSTMFQCESANGNIPRKRMVENAARASGNSITQCTDSDWEEKNSEAHCNIGYCICPFLQTFNIILFSCSCFYVSNNDACILPVVRVCIVSSLAQFFFLFLTSWATFTWRLFDTPYFMFIVY